MLIYVPKFHYTIPFIDYFVTLKLNPFAIFFALAGFKDAL
jgi:hypothetical protein